MTFPIKTHQALTSKNSPATGYGTPLQSRMDGGGKGADERVIGSSAMTQAAPRPGVCVWWWWGGGANERAQMDLNSLVQPSATP